MGEGTAPQAMGPDRAARPRLALILSVLFFVAVYVWGLIWGLRSLSVPRGQAAEGSPGSAELR